ncbi:hypothetical protein K458DRAFT_344246, partial [Lentithecium fluviatile CBS 122367]
METAIARNSNSSSSIPQCCCGSSNCAFLVHNGKLLEGLERDVSKAAQLGQALLVRHETYVAESERERKHMLSTIGSLEQQKLNLEAQNAQTIKANRHLLDQLEQLNEAVASSDAHCQELEDALHSSEEEIQRLSSLVARTQNLERQLIDLEREQSELQTSLELKTGEERDAVRRAREAEATINHLQDEIDRIDKESRKERKKHEDLQKRMERQLAVERELATGAGRSKRRAAHDEGGPNVVSHFVNDIMLDNVTLQNGILELREMLFKSNEEVARLRQELAEHQPVTTPVEEVATATLQKELGGETVINQKVHITNNYYHGPAPTPKTPKAQHYRRPPRNKRYSITTGQFTPPVQADASSQAAIMSQTTVTIPNTNRWSNATTLAPSLPSSPLSMSHRGSIYDRVFSDVQDDSSRPTSPSDSVGPQSPMFAPSKPFEQIDAFRHHRKKSQSLKPPSLSTIRSVSTPISITTKSSPATAIVSASSPANSLPNDIFTLSPSIAPQSAIPEENEDMTLSSPSPNRQPLTSPEEEDIDENLLSPMTPVHPILRRAASHESLISVSGMDIHTLQSHPSQLLLSTSPRFGTPGSARFAQPELTPWTATATASISRRDLDSSTLNRSLLYSTLSTPQRRVSGGGSNSTPRARQTSGLTTKLGGWVLGKWGATPTSSRPSPFPIPVSTLSASLSNPSSPRPQSSQSAETQSSTDTVKKGQRNAWAGKEKKEKVKLRPAGVNQSGPIWGFFDVRETPVKVCVEEFDAEALGEALAE